MALVFKYTPPRINAAAALAVAGEVAVDAAAEHLLQASQPLVPVKEGDLRDSGRVEHAAPLHARVIYDATSPEGYPYGIRQHEDMELHHPNGGQAKFLEQPMHTEGEAVAGILAAALAKVLR